jgi:hypothetical protein
LAAKATSAIFGAHILNQEWRCLFKKEMPLARLAVSVVLGLRYLIFGRSTVGPEPVAGKRRFAENVFATVGCAMRFDDCVQDHVVRGPRRVRDFE